jgi:hypothetical protein
MPNILEHLTEFELVTASPFSNLPKSIFAITMLIIFLVLTLRFVRYINKGVTLSGPIPLPLPLVVRGGDVRKKHKNRITTYVSPASTAILSLVFYFVAHFMIIVLFKTVNYTFVF